MLANDFELGAFPILAPATECHFTLFTHLFRHLALYLHYIFEYYIIFFIFLIFALYF